MDRADSLVRRLLPVGYPLFGTLALGHHPLVVVLLMHVALLGEEWREMMRDACATYYAVLAGYMIPPTDLVRRIFLLTAL